MPVIDVPYLFQQFNGLYPVPQAVVDAACAHALNVFPLESVGIVFNDEYHPVTNSSPNPHTEFEVTLADQLAVCRPDQIQAVIHSHPNGLEGPTVSDMTSQVNSNVPYGIIVIRNNVVVDVLFFGDGMPVAPYEGRPFKPGVYDCFSLVRERFRDFGVYLRDIPRDPEWWGRSESPDMLVDHIVSEGFEIIGEDELRPGDGFLAKPFKTTKICHCGIYEGNGIVLHHFGSIRSQRLSTYESIYNMKSQITHFVRHKDTVQPSASKDVPDAE